MSQKLSFGLNAPEKAANGPKPVTASQKPGMNFDADADSGAGTDETAKGSTTESTKQGGTKSAFSLKISGKGRPILGQTQAGAKRKKTIFDDSDDETGQDTTKNQPGVDKEAGGTRNHSGKKNQQFDFKNVSSLRSSIRYAKDAEAMDPSIFDYDGVYESLHAEDEKRKKERDNDDGDGDQADPDGKKKNKYTAALLKSVEIRKRDQLRARERLLAREREAEGDAFADKEAFVTSAYRKQQEETRRLTEEEAEKERQDEERRKAGVGLTGLYKDMLKRDEERHEAIMAATKETEEKRKKGELPEDKAEEDKGKSDADIAAELNAQGAKVELNEEGQVVDKRELLAAGLNVSETAKEKSQRHKEKLKEARKSRPPPQHHKPPERAGQDDRSRGTEEFLAQLEARMS